MTNDERSPNLEIRNGETRLIGVPFDLRLFLRHSSFGFRHFQSHRQAYVSDISETLPLVLVFCG